MRKLLFIVAILISLSGRAKANDATYYASGNQLVPLQETDISVHKEVLTISLQDNGYALVDVYYEFWNPGKQTRQLLMGFEANPPYNDDWTVYTDGKHKYIYDFVVEMNGKSLMYKNAVCRAGLDTLSVLPAKNYIVFDDNLLYEGDPEKNEQLWYTGIPFAYVYYFTADFVPGLNRVHHTYSYKMSAGVGFPWSVQYKLSPAARWANKQIDDFTLIVRADSTAKHFRIFQNVFPSAQISVTEGVGKYRMATYYGKGTYEFSLRNGAVAMHVDNFQPKEELSIAAAYECCDAPLASFYDRSSSMPLGYATWDAELNPLSDKDKAFFVRLAHNLPYAHRGHVFKNPALAAFFESLWWYMPDPDYQDSTADFTDTDREYIDFKFGK